ncbi:MAG: hypothetical protein MUP45_03580 [Candidatus Marinimicrobia bacterium]|nr:hypothetical protein [Candidatus Neomarinimicrobiota bacterium]
MQFKDRLKEFMEEQEKKKAEDLARREERESEKRKEKKSIRIRVKESREIIRGRFVPFFDAINEVFLDNRGVIKVSVTKNISKRDITGLRLSLKWDYKTYDLGGREGNCVDLDLDFLGNVNLSGSNSLKTDSSRTKFKLEDDDWQQKLEDGILKILSEPEYYHWYVPGTTPTDY